MKLLIQSPREFILAFNPLLAKKNIDKQRFEAFKSLLHQYKNNIKQQINSSQTETNTVTNVLKPFLDGIGYLTHSYSQKGQSGIDLAVMQEQRPVVIIEAKKHNARDMLMEANPNVKAFQEAILYFMRERDSGNSSIYHIIITDFYNWFIFDAKEFEHLFWKNPSFKKILKSYKDTNQLLNTTAEVYPLLEKAVNDLSKDLLDDETIQCTAFHLEKNQSESELRAMYKILSPDCLLKQFNPNDANALNREFYNELLYILGLEESKVGGKKIISHANARQSGSLLENITNQLKLQGKPNDFESAIRLIIIWVNRLLFLKLLESQIVSWTGDASNKFLHQGKIALYDKLNSLFFEILAKEIEDRSNHEFDYIPYLNSSLFERHADEDKLILISSLSEDAIINYYSKTVVKDSNSKRKIGEVNTLAYLFEFLDAFDFSNDSMDEVVSEQKSLINASVLGLIFEKINGYKDGSFYTPSFITMYMARESITKAVLDKFNVVKKWECKNLSELHNKISDIAEANNIINSVTICDPAVGSGHFLVSALNELIYIKSELGVLVDEAGKRLRCTISIENDELIIIDDEGECFTYEKNSTSKTRIQRTLFNEKQTLIENCLFGVDINPNSVNICRLRLWIELLKNAYYKDDGKLETLPNIDINIKCGNSLISRFGLNDDIKDKKIKPEIEAYKKAVKDYKENVGKKHDVMARIDAIKAKFSTKLQTENKSVKYRNNVLTQYYQLFGTDGLNKELQMVCVNIGILGLRQVDIFGNVKSGSKTSKSKLLKSLTAAQLTVVELESGKIYENAFEWRFEFPEVLDAEGNYIGFDVVIGNPPYIDSEAMVNSSLSIQRDYIQSRYQLTKGNWDIYIAFFERSLSIRAKQACVAFITPDKWLTKPFGQELIKQHSSEFSSIIKAGRDVFDSANVDALITIINSYNNESLQALQIENNVFVLKSRVDIPISGVFSFDALFSDNLSLINKISQSSVSLSDFATCVNACATSDAYKLKEYIKDADENNGSLDFKVVNTGTVGKYQSRYGLSPMTYLKDKYLNPVVNKCDFLANFKNTYGITSEKPKLIGKGLTLLDWFVDEYGEYIAGKSTLVVLAEEVSVLKFLSAILNSKAVFFYIKGNYSSASYNGGVNFTKDMINTIPIPNTNQQPFIQRVDQILTAKKLDVKADTKDLENQIDKMVFKLYGLTYDEVKIIDPEFALSAHEYEALNIE